jgi:hypothetical protein
MLTDMKVRELKVRSKRYEIRDDDPKTTGLVVRVTKAGAKTFALRYRNEVGVARCLTLGQFPKVTLSEARDRARNLLARIRLRADPQGETIKARAAAMRTGATLRDVAERWLAEGRTTKKSREGEPWRPKTRSEFTRIMRQEILPPLGDLEPGELTKKDIRALYDRTEKRSASAAKHLLAVLRVFYQWASEEDYVDAVPTFPKRSTQSGRRERVLDEDELRRVWGALHTGLGSLPAHARYGPETGRGPVDALEGHPPRERRYLVGDPCRAPQGWPRPKGATDWPRSRRAEATPRGYGGRRVDLPGPEGAGEATVCRESTKGCQAALEKVWRDRCHPARPPTDVRDASRWT